MSKQTSIDKPQCPRGHGTLTPIKSWILHGWGRDKTEKRGEKTGTKVTAWRCTHKLANGKECGYSHRTYDKLEE